MKRDEFEQFVKDLFGESVARVVELKDEQIERVEEKIQEIAQEGMKEELNRLESEIRTLQERVARLESEKADDSGEIVS